MLRICSTEISKQCFLNRMNILEVFEIDFLTLKLSRICWWIIRLSDNLALKSWKYLSGKSSLWHSNFWECNHGKLNSLSLELSKIFGWKIQWSENRAYENLWINNSILSHSKILKRLDGQFQFFRSCYWINLSGMSNFQTLELLKIFGWENRFSDTWAFEKFWWNIQFPENRVFENIWMENSFF